ncbi:transcription factor TFIIIB subunit brf1 [Podila clonocystis]|nr:transcription factor TFIIIB subunit brf1 [Podila clonocystis]
MDTPDDDMSWEGSYGAGSPSEHVMTEDFGDESLECPSCGSRNSIVDEWETTICTDCGLVLEESPVVIKTSDAYKYQLKKVDPRGRPGSTAVYYMAGRMAHSGFMQNRENVHKKFVALRSSHAKETIQAAGRLVDATAPTMDRALHLWRAVYGKWQVKAGDLFDCMALACLYLVSKEMSTGLSLIRLASVSNRSHLKIGAVFKKVSKVLHEHNLIDLDSTVYSTEDNHWIELTRLLDLRYDKMPQDLQEMIDPSDSRSRFSHLKEILTVSQKVLAITIESGVATGRQVSGVVAACVVLALQYHLKSKTKHPTGLMEFARGFFAVSDTRIKLQAREVEGCMMDWIRRLPYVRKNKRFKPNEIVDYMDEVFGYFQNFHADNQAIWNAVDRLVLEDEEEETEADEGAPYEVVEEDGDQPDPGTPVPDQEAEVSEENSLVDEVPEQLQPAFRAILEATRGKKTEVDRAAVFLPRSFKASERQRKRQRDRLRIAKESLDMVTKSKPEKGISRINAQDEMVKQMRTLLMLGTRTEQELVDAPPGTLTYWAKRDAAPISPDHDLDAKELSDKDLKEEEWRKIVRSDRDSEAYWRVNGPDIVLGEAISKRHAEYNEWKVEYKRRKKAGTFVDTRKLDAKVKVTTRPKSSRLNYAALEQLRREEEEERGASSGKSIQGTQKTVQGAHETVQEIDKKHIEPEKEEEDEDKEDEEDYEEEEYEEYTDHDGEQAYEWEMEEEF